MTCYRSLFESCVSIMRACGNDSILTLLDLMRVVRVRLCIQKYEQRSIPVIMRDTGWVEGTGDLANTTYAHL